jgi:predicted transcriptional regulator
MTERTPEGKDQATGRAIELTDPRALRAVAHPTRLALIGLLRTEGPLTATRAGELLGQSAASCSFHLRQLAKYGLVEEAGGGTGRQRPWRATAQFTTIPKVPTSGDMAAASQLFTSVLTERYFEEVMSWLERWPGEPSEWQEAAAFGDSLLYLTAEELAELKLALFALAERYQERTPRRELRPEGSRQVTFLRLAYPSEPLTPPPSAPSTKEAQPPARPPAPGSPSTRTSSTRTSSTRSDQPRPRQDG